MKKVRENKRYKNILNIRNPKNKNIISSYKNEKI
ncbi:Uncharacterised protein [Brachyspira pilosicoli]|nr:Uncharacterised protein [Brachyspira pilosicoli]